MAGRPLLRARRNGQDPRYVEYKHRGGTLSYEVWSVVIKSIASALPPALAPEITPPPPRRGTAYADLMAELRWLGPAVVMQIVTAGNTKQCGYASLAVAQYLIERGFDATHQRGARKYADHVDLAVHTSDRGWISVDPTAVQFHSPISEQQALQTALDKLDIDIESTSREQRIELISRFLEPTVQWSVNGMLDGVRAFEITDASHVGSEPVEIDPERPQAGYMGATWAQHWYYFRGLAEDLARGDFEKIDEHVPLNMVGTRGYWIEELSRRLRGKKLSA
jgi:hypothetical protein